MLALRYPVDELLVELRADGKKRRRPLHPQTIHLAVHRLDNSVYYKRIAPEEYNLLSALAAGKPFEDALEVAFGDDDPAAEERLGNLQAAFANWAELGWFCRPRGTR
jgi:hypothetical protein